MANDIKEFTLEFSSNPLAYLLILCDQIEVWDRQTGQETRFSNIPLECAELAQFEHKRDQNKFLIQINYVPFRYILPSTPHMDVIKKNLRDVLDIKTIPALNRIKFDLQHPRIIMTFMVDRREQVGAWKSHKDVIT